MEIRELKPSELSQLLQLYEHLHEGDDPLPSEEVLKKVWEQIRKDENHKIFGVFTNGDLVSSCVLCVIPNLTRGCLPYGLIENVVTHENYRKRGHGKAVLHHALNYAWSKGCYKVMLLTGRKDESTYRFYESVGFARNAKQAFLAKPRPDEQ